MLKDVLRSIHRGGRSIGSISLELGMDRGEVLQIIQQLERMGLLKEVKDDGRCSRKTCRGCPMSKICSGNSLEGPDAKFFIITDKGNRALGGK